MPIHIETPSNHPKHEHPTLPDILTAKNLIALYFNRLHQAPAWMIADRLMTYSRRFMFITKIFKYTAMVISFIETSAILIVGATFALTFLPVILAVSIIANVADDIHGSRLLKKLDLKLDSDRIYVFFKDGRMTERTARLYGEKSAVYIVANSFRRRFFTAKADGNLIFINKAFFMRLRMSRFETIPEKMTYVF